MRPRLAVRVRIILALLSVLVVASLVYHSYWSSWLPTRNQVRLCSRVVNGVQTHYEC